MNGLIVTWVLINSRAECNFISQMWAKQHLPDFKSLPRCIEAIDGHKILSFVDADGLTCDHEYSFEAVNMASYDVILGYLANAVEFMEPEEFEDVVCTGSTAFIIHPCDLDPSGKPIAFFGGVTATEFKLPVPYEEYMELFDENPDLAVHAPHNHVIDIELGKDPPY
ncbi:hypothetical protein FQN52_000056 [Onygenales sp. PD_12]|nr:hypothetical protein FQN52_000056 [Onygenales sp. PD_12]